MGKIVVEGEENHEEARLRLCENRIFVNICHAFLDYRPLSDNIYIVKVNIMQLTPLNV